MIGQNNNDFINDNMMQFLSKAYQQLNQILFDYAIHITDEFRINKE